jgi:flagellar motor switch protein FliN/FliY
MSIPDLKPANIARAQFNELGPNGGGATGQEMNLNLILDVAVTLALEVGRARMSVRDLLQLAPGAIVELDRLHAAKSSWSTINSAFGSPMW